MHDIAIGLVVLLVLLLVGQGVLVFGLVRSLRNWQRPVIGDAECPKAAVVLCLRGTDPFLEQILLALLDLDYPDYEAHIIVDSPQDPAWQLVHDVVGRSAATNVTVAPLTERRDTCSLKCSSLIQAIGGLDDSYEIVAQLDADTIPHKTWLRELIAPLLREDVGATTGNRWYMPTHATAGAMVRYLWNACAIIQMFWYRIAWGGTLAVKTSVIRKCGLLERWGNAFCEDTMLFAALRDEGLRIEFVPSLMMVNRETCDLKGFFHWVARQLLTARLYHPRFSSVVAHGAMVTVVSAATLAIVVWAAVESNVMVAIGVMAAWIIYELLLTLFIVPMETSVRRIIGSRGQPTQWVGIRAIMVGLISVLLLQVVYPAALFWAMVVRMVSWRGIAYRIQRPAAIRMVEYQPYLPEKSYDDDASL